MQIALGQINMIWEDCVLSLKKAEKMIQSAKQQRAELIVFPETSFTGVSLDLHKIGEDSAHSTTVECIRGFAQKYHIAIGFGWAALPLNGTQKGTNHFTVVDQLGMVLGDYQKIHPFSMGGESEVYQGGSQLVTIPFQHRMISLFVCYDLRFPEIFQLAAKQADLFLVIANWPACRQHAWEILLQARAIECEADVAGINCTGSQDGIIYGGGSMIVDAKGDILQKMDHSEGILVCEMPDEASAMRQRFCVFDDRREELYKSLYATKNQNMTDE
jgi:omega-amidase